METIPKKPTGEYFPCVRNVPGTGWTMSTHT